MQNDFNGFVSFFELSGIIKLSDGKNCEGREQTPASLNQKSTFQFWCHNIQY